MANKALYGLTGLVAGSLAGWLYGTLTAPRSGEETIEKWQESLDKFKEELKDTTNELEEAQTLFGVNGKEVLGIYQNMNKRWEEILDILKELPDKEIYKKRRDIVARDVSAEVATLVDETPINLFEDIQDYLDQSAKNKGILL